ncbi:MAG: O-antigen ligase family protein [bacterium]|nr:O-antigen ligase family protein [bacterium]
MISYQTLSRAFFVCMLLVLALPLLSLPPLFSPPDWGKTLVFRVLLCLEVIIAGAILFFHPQNLRKIEWRKKEGAGFLILLGILGLFLLATLFSFDHTFSIWGSPFRSGGMVNFASYILFAVLAFLILKSKDWNRTWAFATGIAVLVSMMALIQWQGLFTEIFVKTGERPTSSLGNPILLAMYLMFFVFTVLALAIKESVPVKKILYFSLVALFLFVILITQSRSSYVGLAFGFSFFLIFYPFKNPLRAHLLKGLFAVLATMTFASVYFVNVTLVDALPRFIQENNTLLGITKRMSINSFLQDPRFSTWQIAWQSLKERPLLGYGPENFEVAFDRNYDPRLPGIQLIQETPNSWWDRAHNSFLDIATQAGIPAALLYFALFAVLFMQLQKIKERRPDQKALIHGIQATFIGYLVTDFFSFDAFSTFIISSLLVSYCLFLIHTDSKETEEETQAPSPTRGIQKKVALLGFAVFLAWFSWNYALQPLLINEDLNLGIILAKTGQCENAIKFLDKAVFESKETFLNPYTRFKYFDTLKLCNDQGALSNAETVRKGYDALKEASEAWPNHTRTWIFLGQLTNISIEQQGKAGTLSPEQRTEGIAQANSYFEKARQLSPGHLEVYIDWIKTFLLIQDYQGARAKAQECIDVNEKTGECWFLKGIVEQFAGDDKQSSEYIKTAKAKGFYPEKSMSALTILAQAYLTSQDLGKLADIYAIMVSLQPANYQLRASLAFTYYQLLEFDKAREQALKVLEYNPASKAEVEEFLKLLR